MKFSELPGAPVVHSPACLGRSHARMVTVNLSWIVLINAGELFSQEDCRALQLQRGLEEQLLVSFSVLSSLVDRHRFCLLPIGDNFLFHNRKIRMSGLPLYPKLSP